MDFTPSHRIRSQMTALPSAETLAHTLPVPVFIAMKRLRGVRQFARCAFEGFHSPEKDGKGKYIWSGGDSAVTCHFPATAKLQYAWVEIASTAPDGSVVSISLNGRTVVTDKHIKGRSTVLAKLPQPEVFHKITLGIESSTFSASSTGQQDERELGIALRAIVFGKRATKYRAGSVVRPPLHQKLAKVLPWSKGKRKRRRQAA